MKTPKQTSKNSIQELAKALKLSPATISRVLNNHPHVHTTTRNRVMAFVEKTGYTRNIMASGLRTNRTNTVGLIVPKFSMFVHTEVITTIQSGLHAHGYNLIICQSNDSIEMEKDLARTLYASRVDAVIAACTLFTNDFSHFDILTENDIPVLFYDRVPVQPYPACIVKGDDFRGGFLAASHLIQLGCKRIAYISGPLTCNIYIDRFAGFEKAMTQHKISIHKDWVFYHELTADNARKTMYRLFAKAPFPDAIMAANDVTAITVLEYAKEVGIKIPGDLRIVGYSNDPRSAIISPSITTIEQFPVKIGKVIVMEVLKRLKNDNGNDVLSPEPIIVPVELIRRMST
ncbi:PurR family transcriptional regulator [Niastella koreensis]|uniref:Transcriptional regulator, LacI family n=2 Tax=Niastella koreensis TaxID=354356 RepID=G8TDN3_NIAKG|nr:LacI family DNA-binding transcriptional regulator [Niastella koreensis]AEW01483.1 transcriptional regulator, LacI family [Niastella koreensis GR20-10]OQP48210.1 PurR family transcriptional regulator [Niastella koreensis]